MSNTLLHPVAEVDFYPGKMVIVKFQDGYRLVVNLNNTPANKGVERVELFNVLGRLVADYHAKRLDFRGNVDRRGRVENLVQDFTLEMLAERWQSAEQHLQRTMHPDRGQISDEGLEFLRRGQALLLLHGASDWAWEHNNRVVEDSDKANERLFKHKCFNSNDFGDDWWCTYCYQSGTPYDGDRPEDKPCVPHDRPADWNFL